MAIDDLWYQSAIIWRNTSLITLHNVSGRRQRVRFTPACANGHLLVDVFDGDRSGAPHDGAHRVTLGPYERRWFRVGASDNVLNRSDLDLMT